MNRLEKILTVTTVALAIVVVFAASLLYVTHRIQNVGRIRSIGVKFYIDENCTVQLTDIYWGELQPGSVHQITSFCRNEENTALTMNMTTNMWDPPRAVDYLTLTWNYTSGQVLQPNDVIPITFQLSVNGSVSGIDTFSFDIVVGSIEYEPLVGVY